MVVNTLALRPIMDFKIPAEESKKVAAEDTLPCRLYSERNPFQNLLDCS